MKDLETLARFADIVDDPQQTDLAHKHIVPHLDEVEKALRCLREQVDRSFLSYKDPVLQTLSEAELNVPHIRNLTRYPQGYCGEISGHIWDGHVRQFIENEQVDYAGITALRNFERAGGNIRRVFVIQNNSFQNAVQIGDIWFDVAHNTVDVTKNPVHICPVSESGAENIDSYIRYAEVLELYWKYRVYPNMFYHNFAPYFPYIIVNSLGQVVLNEVDPYLVLKNMLRRGKLAEDFFESRFGQTRLPEEYVGVLQRGHNQMIHSLVKKRGLKSDKNLRVLFDFKEQDRDSIHAAISRILGVSTIKRETLSRLCSLVDDAMEGMIHAQGGRIPALI